MKLIMKKILVILMIICTLFPMLFSNISLAEDEDSILLTTERAGNYAATFAINFFQNWSSVNYYQEEEMKNISSNSSLTASGEFTWPVPDALYVSSGYGLRDLYNNGNLKLHESIDIPAPKGTAIVASDSGIVIAKTPESQSGGYGETFTIDHKNGLYTRYSHCSTILVEIGDSVSKGEKIAEVGNTGLSVSSNGGDGSHLDFSIFTEATVSNGKLVVTPDWKENKTIDPWEYLPYDKATGVYSGEVVKSPNSQSSSSSSSVQTYGEIKTAYDDSASEINNPVQPEDEQYIFSNKSWIDFVFKNSLALNNTSYYPSSDYSSNQCYEKIGEDSDLDGEILDITELVNSGKILPGDILYTTQHEYLLFVGGTKVIYAQQPYGSEGALKYEYLQTYLRKVKTKLLNANIDNPDYELEAYGITDVYRVKQEFIATASIKENTQNLFFNNKGYFDPNTKYSGIPVTGAYEGSTHTSLFSLIIKCIEDIFTFIINLLFYIIRAVIVGWVSIIESIIQSVVLSLNGNTAQLALADQNTGISATSYSDGKVTVESLFFNKLPITDANFFNFKSAGGYSLKDENGNPTMLYVLRENLSTWYLIIRNLSIAIMLFILLYIGIRMALTSIAEKKAEFKKYLIDWVQALIIVMFIHFFMYIIFYLNDGLVQALQKLSYISTANMLGGNITEISLYEAIRTKAYALNFSEGTTGMILYIIMVYLLLRFLLIYLKRAISIYVLGMMGSFMGVKHAFDKANGKKTTSLSKWMKDFAFNVLLQSIHCLMYVVLMTVALSTATQSAGGTIIAIVIIQVMLKADKVFMRIFGINAKGGLLEDVDEPENYFTILGKTKIITGIAQKTFGFGKDIVTGKNPLAEQMQMLKYANPEDDLKTARKKVEMAKLTKKGERADKLDKFAQSRLAPIGLLAAITRTDRQRRLRLLANNSSYEFKTKLYGNLQKEKALKKQRYTRPLKTTKNLAVGAFKTIGGIGLLAEGFAPGLHSMHAGISSLYNEFDPKTGKAYRRTSVNEKYLPGLLGDLQIKNNIEEEKYEKDMKKIKGKQDALEKIGTYEENISESIAELKNHLSTVLESDRTAELERLKDYYKKTYKNTKKTTIRSEFIQKAVNQYMYSKDITQLEDSDFDGLMDKLQEVIDDSAKNKRSNIDLGRTTSRRAEIRASFNGLSLDGLNSKDASALIVENINRPDIVEIPELNIDDDLERIFKDISDNFKNIYSINEKSKITNKESAESYEEVIKEYFKLLGEV